MKEKFLTINGRQVSFSDERNLLEVIRKANIEIPTFCYHSELSIYGACRLCIVDIDGRGIITSCSTKPEEGMNIKTHTSQVREIRKIAIELLLANHKKSCTTCNKSSNCKLQELALKLGVDEVRFKQITDDKELDKSSLAIIRDPNKCILCGDCVRACNEIQGIGAIDFAHRGKNVTVETAFNKDLSKVECVDCGQCARVCPTGALMPKFNIDKVWKEIENPKKTVVAQIAPAVRVALGEMFGMKPGTLLIGQMVSALKMLGFDKVYDTSFTADLTVIEETQEFITRKTKNENLPIMTSCCPAWVKYVEQYFPEFINNLSSCKSPQQMFGAVAKDILPEQLNVKKENLVVVSIMPCTAKKVEADKHKDDTTGSQEVDYVITTQELGAMIKQAGIVFENLTPESLDLPLGFKTGAGLIFGNSGGVTEAVLRNAYEKLSGVKLNNFEFHQVRGKEGVREVSLDINGTNINIAVVHGLKNAKTVLKSIKDGSAKYDMIEVMSCPGGCIGGAGQPAYYDECTKELRTNALYDADKILQLHKSQDNPYIKDLYQEVLGEVNGEKAHHLLHTHYKNRKRILESELSFIEGKDSDSIEVKVCIGTNCFIKGSQNILQKIIGYVEDKEINDIVDVGATFCFEKCGAGPNASVNGEIISEVTFEKLAAAIDTKVKEKSYSEDK